MYVQSNIAPRSCNRFARRKAMGIKCSECVSVAVGIQHEMRMRSIILSSVASPAVRYIFFT
jgi:hypothetical protein